MKKVLLAVLMIALTGGVCACGTVSEKTKVESPTPTATVEAADTVSGAAVSPTPIPNEEAYALADRMIQNMSLEEKVGQMFLVDLYQLDKRHAKDGMVQETTKNMKKTLHRYNIGGVYLMEGNVESTEQTAEMVEDMQAAVVTGGSLYIAVEEDGGGEYSISAKVPELKDTGYVNPKEMSERMTAQQIYESGKTIGKGLGRIGINLNLAPVADIGSEENSSYAMRCLGTEPEKAEELVGQYVKGMREGGMSVTLKHFPGVGNVSGDFSEEILECTESLMALRNENFLPYAAGIQAGADCVMVSNVSVAQIEDEKTPAFMSANIVTNLLRNELKFDGVVMTSPLNENVIRDNFSAREMVTAAVNAGCDMLVLPIDFQESYQLLVDEVKCGSIKEKRIDESVRRILRNKIQKGIIKYEDK